MVQSGDFGSTAGVIPDGTPDPTVLQVAADVGRAPVTGDVAGCEFAVKISMWTPEDPHNQDRWLPERVAAGSAPCSGLEEERDTIPKPAA